MKSGRPRSKAIVLFLRKRKYLTILRTFRSLKYFSKIFDDGNKYIRRTSVFIGKKSISFLNLCLVVILLFSKRLFYEASAGDVVLWKMRSLVPKRHIETSHSPFSCFDSRELFWGANKYTHDALAKINIASFNVLAPCYKRLNSISPGNYARESTQKDLWLNRALSAVNFFESEIFPTAHIIGLQEFWLDEHYQSLMKQSADSFGFKMQTLQRTGLKTDAAVFMIHESFEVLGKKEAYLCNIGDRVGLILWLKHIHTQCELIVANTHLSFPHTEQDVRNQIQQMKILTSTMDNFVLQNGLEHCPKIILGDFNVVGTSGVCDDLREQGYTSCLDISPPLDGLTDQPVSPITHLNHRNEELGVDHIFVKPGSSSPGSMASSGRSFSPSTIFTSHSSLTSSDSTETLTSTATVAVEELKSRTSTATSVFVEQFDVLPSGLGCTQWDHRFSISDHRPVTATIVLASKKDGEDHDIDTATTKA